ncbi:hypothetical protein B0I26_11455 [Anoxybacillus vitaminiphilus]|uniref:Uncharacterized protein n=1 Tax=Paranoxybacillus vitaminiphilus TaxID=581036 RepID=A0A327Y7L9_9BACL|nr:hypothetical protein [Anoxybacillus vitaminiphilus]RAK17050.1 hypothetical protein B0I26_11455 [Anoxybacillus vitaminiphilus]
MKKLPLFFAGLMTIVSLFFYLLGLMKLVPLLIAAPLLFLSILFTLSILNHRNRFNGFKH